MHGCAWNIALQAALSLRGWKDARFAQEAGLSSGGATKVILGDVEPGPSVMKFVQEELGVSVKLWGERTPTKRRTHFAAAA